MWTLKGFLFCTFTLVFIFVYIYKVCFICLIAYQLFMGYLMPKFDSIGLVCLMAYQPLMGYLVLQ